MRPTLQTATDTINQIKHRAAYIEAVLQVLRAIIIGAMTVSLWALVRPQQEFEQLALGALATSVLLLILLVQFFRRTQSTPVSINDFALALEMRHGGKVSTSLETKSNSSAVPPAWAPYVETEISALRAEEKKRLLSVASTLVVPLFVAFMTLPQAAPSFRLALNEVANVVSSLTRAATLTVVHGSATESEKKEWTLSTRKPLELELLAQNLIEIKLHGTGFSKNAPTVELRRRTSDGGKTAMPEPSTGESSRGSAEGEKVFQSFQMMPAHDRNQAFLALNSTDAAHPEEKVAEATQYTISFAVSESVDILIPTMDAEKRLATITVRQLPVPKISLTMAAPPADPWPDDQPLPLAIKVTAENPLQTVRLLVKSGQRLSKELVANVMSEDKTEIETEYRLLLEQYVESDLAEVEIVAEAVDRAVPNSLVGYSEPLRIRTASAYGRYRQALQTLRDLKQQIDQAIERQATKLPPEANETAKQASQQSEQSPFFDGLDRVHVHRFAQRVGELAVKPDAETLLDLSQGLNDFLFEHEILDDRERDRDFFVAIRGLSRLIEQERARRPVGVHVVTERIRSFLNDRNERWSKRIERLPLAMRPSQWRNVQSQKPFHRDMTNIDQLDEQMTQPLKTKSDQLTTLSKTVVEYRAWIEALEEAENKAREQEERERQEGLASARDTMRELQLRQGEITSDLDRSDQRPRAEIEEQWPGTRMKQNTNVRETRRLESQLRSLSPQANHRIQAALQAMEGTLESGNAGNYQLAESASDLAGRLLRQAERAAAQSQQQRRDRGRRRRVTGDNYYGQSVVGGDIETKREYQVDRRYREDILDEVQEANYDDENQSLLENYLRQVIR